MEGIEVSYSRDEIIERVMKIAENKSLVSTPEPFLKALEKVLDK